MTTTTGKLVVLKDGNDQNIFPKTSSLGVYMNDGKSLEDLASESVYISEDVDAIELQKPEMVEKINNIVTQLEQNLHYNIKYFGAKGDGVTDDSQYFINIGSRDSIIIPKGIYFINNNITIDCDLMFLKGAIIKIADGCTITINGTIKSGLYKIFEYSDSSSIIVNPAKNKVGFPEWFGAVANDGNIDCTKAIEDCIKIMTVTELQLADYFCNDTIEITDSRKKLIGVNNYKLLDDMKSSRIIVQSATKDVIFLGKKQKPEDIVYYVTNTVIQDVELTRSIVPTPAAKGSEINSPTGLRMQYCYMCDIEKVRTSENSNGFVIAGTVYCHFRRSTSFRSLQGTTPDNDTFIGFFINGNTDIGLASGNASLYISDCNSIIGGSVTYTDSIGFLVEGKGADLNLFRPESANINSGIIINGDDSTTGNVDIHIVQPIIDQFKSNGIWFNNIGKYASIDLTNGYFAPVSAEVTVFSIRFNNFLGMASITNNQCIGWQNGLALGLWIENSTGISAKNNMYLGFKRPVCILSSSNNSIMDTINNPNEIAIQGAIYLTGTSNRNYINSIIKGGTNVFPQGVIMIGDTCHYNEVNCTAIDSSCIIGGSGNKLLYNDSKITSIGVFGTDNLANGVMV